MVTESFELSNAASKAVFAFCIALYELLGAFTAMNINSRSRAKAYETVSSPYVRT